jgi:hypothetical protein
MRNCFLGKSNLPTDQVESKQSVRTSRPGDFSRNRPTSRLRHHIELRIELNERDLLHLLSDDGSYEEKGRKGGESELSAPKAAEKEDGRELTREDVFEFLLSDYDVSVVKGNDDKHGLCMRPRVLVRFGLEKDAFSSTHASADVRNGEKAKGLLGGADLLTNGQSQR